ncbi:MAG TPA: DUF554 domain-containing protein [Symbiobacteriaceae bacterium]|nr:DUF554 domain-containing protein [Symbiobacteriaceae bacterium]
MLPVGPLVNVSAVLAGGFLGALLGNKIPERLRVALPLTFGAASMGMGINMIVKLGTLPVVILSLLLGSAFGELVKFEKGIEWLAQKVRGPIEKVFGTPKGAGDDFMQKFVGIVVLFCASGTGIFGALNEGMTGNSTVLITKSFLDFFTAAIFATGLGYLVMTIAVPQALVLVGLFFGAGVILPMTNAAMIADFSGVGGVIMLATGLRISGIKAFPIANLLPALLIVMPLSSLWATYMVK